MTFLAPAKVEPGVVQFFEGILNSSNGETSSVVWAESAFGNRKKVDPEVVSLDDSEIAGINGKTLVTSIDLTGLERDDAIFVIDSILIGGYWSRPGVRGKHDSALFLLVNEAINSLHAVDDGS